MSFDFFENGAHGYDSFTGAAGNGGLSLGGAIGNDLELS